jgi:hypothetical protein
LKVRCGKGWRKKEKRGMEMVGLVVVIVIILTAIAIAIAITAITAIVGHPIETEIDPRGRGDLRYFILKYY